MERASNIALVVHGGAGRDIQPGRRGADFERACRAGLEAALRAGWERLQAGDGALDAVETAVRILEDDPYFNAGRGASLSHAGMVEMDASIMDGATGGAGAVAGLTTVKNPITLARAVLERSPFVFLVAPGAEDFAGEIGIERVENSYFVTSERLAQHKRLLEQGGGVAVTASLPEDEQDQKLGTVGAVAVDSDGNIAAATSTGGMAGKRYGRVGDSPLIGAGTWADNATCGVSCTGHGEYFIQQAVAYAIAARMDFGGASVAEAAEATLARVTALDGAGGLIALDRQGNAALPFNTPGMYRGYITRDGVLHTAIYAGEG